MTKEAISGMRPDTSMRIHSARRSRPRLLQKWRSSTKSPQTDESLPGSRASLTLLIFLPSLDFLQEPLQRRVALHKVRFRIAIAELHCALPGIDGGMPCETIVSVVAV